MSAVAGGSVCCGRAAGPASRGRASTAAAAAADPGRDLRQEWRASRAPARWPSPAAWSARRSSARHRRAERRFLPAILRGDEMWCQLFSEPGAGSDLAVSPPAPCATATSGWSTGRRCGPRRPMSRLGHPARPHRPRRAQAQGHHLLPRRHGTPGDRHPAARQVTGDAHFSEVFLADVRIPADHVLGEVGQGWRAAPIHPGQRAGAMIGGNSLMVDLYYLVGLARRSWADRRSDRPSGTGGDPHPLRAAHLPAATAHAPRRR